MFTKEESFRNVSYDEELAKARWYNEDLNKGGWNVVEKSERYTSWTKTFPDEDIPIKVLAKFNFPFSAEQFVEVFNPRNIEYRNEWDKTFLDNMVLQQYPANGGTVMTNRIKLPWPLSDRDFVLFIPPTKEVDWYGKRAFHMIYINAWHPSKPADAAGCVRATNGGNFFIVIPDEKVPENACSLFTLSHNDLRGWLPKANVEWLVGRLASSSFRKFFENVTEGQKMFFAKS